MLIEFSAKNFRSIRERQTLSMVAAPRLRRNTERNVFTPDLPGEKFPRLLKVAVIYGPNASGKSNILRALAAVSDVTRRQPDSAMRRSLPGEAFRFDPELAGKPSEFELHFIAHKMRYQFELHLLADRIVFERLVAYPKGEEALLYSRSYSDHAETYIFGKLLDSEVGPSVLDTWRKITPPTALFISQAVANSSEDVNLLRRPYEWLSLGMVQSLNGMGRMMRSSQRLAANHPTIALEIAEFLRDVDVPIVKFSVTTPEDTEATGDSDSPTERIETPLRTVLTHASALGPAEMAFQEESMGTQNLVGFWLPWFTKNDGRDVKRNVLVVDELDSSLHPMIVAALVEKHISDPVATQLIFSTHDTHLMDAKLLRRDQIWVTERDMNGATKLSCVHDFEGREGEDIEKRYFAGRYRGLPLVKMQ